MNRIFSILSCTFFFASPAVLADALPPPKASSTTQSPAKGSGSVIKRVPGGDKKVVPPDSLELMKLMKNPEELPEPADKMELINTSCSDRTGKSFNKTDAGYAQCLKDRAIQFGAGNKKK